MKLDNFCILTSFTLLTINVRAVSNAFFPFGQTPLVASTIIFIILHCFGFNKRNISGELIFSCQSIFAERRVLKCTCKKEE